MSISPASPGSVSASTGTDMEAIAAKLAKSQQEAEGQAALQLLQSVPAPSTSGDLAIGSNINIVV